MVAAAAVTCGSSSSCCSRVGLIDTVVAGGCSRRVRSGHRGRLCEAVADWLLISGRMHSVWSTAAARDDMR